MGDPQAGRERTHCYECKGHGVIVGYACPGFRRIETLCKPCGGTGVAPEWQAEAVQMGDTLRIRRRGSDIGLREAAKADGLTAATRSDCELGRIPFSQWPETLRQQALAAVSPPREETNG